MVWQDIVITICIIASSYALVPQIYQGFKQKKGFINIQTSSITSVALYIISFSYMTLKLYFSSAMTLTAAVLWTILFSKKCVINET